jgi:hypothetical protein
VSFGPVEFAGVDTFAALVAASADGDAANILSFELAVLDAFGAARDRSVVAVRPGERRCVTVSLGPADAPCRLRFQLGFEERGETSAFGSLSVTYALAYENNQLVELFNAVGSDKGTTVCAGGGVPHCYAVAYGQLFAPFRHERFGLLEIGLDNSPKPADAPSLRAWRAFFPYAEIYGYDRNDFSFFNQPQTFTFRGDQASREDLARFLAASGASGFRIVVDDGSHASSHQQISLAALFPSLQPHGLYVIEDLGWQPFAETPTTLTVLEAFCERGAFESPFVTEAEAAYLAGAIARIRIFKPNDSEFAVIEKKG